MIREIKVEDAASFLQLSKQLDEETKFMLYEPGERKFTAEQQEQMIQRFVENKYATILVAVEEERIVGFILVNGNHIQRKRHVASIVIGILQEYSGRGIGTRLFKEVEKWARLHDVWRLELTVYPQYKRAQALYKKLDLRKKVSKELLLLSMERTSMSMKYQIIKIRGRYMKKMDTTWYRSGDTHCWSSGNQL